MSAVLDETMAVEVVFTESDAANQAAREQNLLDVMSMNMEATATEAEDFAAFIELLSVADAEYIDAAEYAPEPPAPLLDWDAVSQALNESQQILIGVQNLLAETLAAMGVEDYQYVRVYADMDGGLRLVSGHPRREEIESVLNNAENAELRNLYHSAMAGMSLAGDLVGTISAPAEVLERVKAKSAQYAA